MELPVERRLNTRLKSTDLGVTHRIEEYFDDKKFSDGFALSDPMRDKLDVIATELQSRFFGDGEIDTTDVAHEPFYFACAVVSIIECRPRIALVEPPAKLEQPEQPNLDRIDSLVGMYLRRNPYIDTLISTYADKIGDIDSEDEIAAKPRMTFPRLFSGMTFFLLECENALEYADERAVAKGMAIFQNIADAK